jgi:excisionase family DNA binding protein
VNAARGVLAWARDPDDPEGEQGYRRVLVPVATNWGKLAPTLAAHIESAEVSSDDGPIDVPKLTIDGNSEITASDLQRGADEAGSSGADAVLLALTDDWRNALAVKNEVADQLGTSHRTIERYAKQLERDGLIERDRQGFPAVAVWRRSVVATQQVATDPDAPGVVTGQSPADTRDPRCAAPSSDSVSALRAREVVEPEPEANLTFREAADHLGCTHDQLHGLINDNHLQARHDGRRRVFARAELDACRDRGLTV